MKILITGGCGFVGSNLAIGLKKKHPNYSICALDNLKRRGSELNLSRLKEHEVSFIHGDIRNRTDFDEVGEVDLVIDAAAEPSVLAGTQGGLDYLIDTNLNGTINTLHYAKTHDAAFIFLSTSRVYPIQKISNLSIVETETRFSLTDEQSENGVTKNGISEQFTLEGERSFYGATKLASELFVQEYASQGLRTVINRSGVISGPYQMGKVDQGVVVLWMARHYWRQPLNYIGFGGTGKQVRDVLHIDDLLDLIDWQIHHLDDIAGKKFNVGGGLESSVSLMELTRLCQEITGNQININSQLENRPGDIPLYLTDNKTITELSGWSPRRSVKGILENVYYWIDENENSLEKLLN